MKQEPRCVIALFGPTAVGKTDVALALADLLNAQGINPVAISADAYQLYQGLQLTSGAPTPEQQDQLEHLLVGSHEVDTQMSAGRFAALAHEAIDDSLASGLQPIVIGGSGLYMQAALTDLEMRPPVSNPSTQANSQETDEPHARLRSLSPAAAEQIDPGDRYRAARAVSLAQAGYRPEPGEDFWGAQLRHPTLRFALVRDRPDLYRCIDERVDAMVAAGAAAEILAIRERASPTARRIIGFDELPRGEIDEMKHRTRRYAKRQMTWARRMPGTETINLSETSEEAAAALIAGVLTATRE